MSVSPVLRGERACFFAHGKCKKMEKNGKTGLTILRGGVH